MEGDIIEDDDIIQPAEETATIVEVDNLGGLLDDLKVGTKTSVLRKLWREQVADIIRPINSTIRPVYDPPFVMSGGRVINPPEHNIDIQLTKDDDISSTNINFTSSQPPIDQDSSNQGLTEISRLPIIDEILKMIPQDMTPMKYEGKLVYTDSTIVLKCVKQHIHTYLLDNIQVARCKSCNTPPNIRCLREFLEELFEMAFMIKTNDSFTFFHMYNPVLKIIVHDGQNVSKRLPGWKYILGTSIGIILQGLSPFLGEFTTRVQSNIRSRLAPRLSRPPARRLVDLSAK